MVATPTRVFFFNDTATTEIYTLSLHDALPICSPSPTTRSSGSARRSGPRTSTRRDAWPTASRSEEHTSELQSLAYLVCRLLLEKKREPVAVFRSRGLLALRHRLDREIGWLLLG